MEPTIFRKLANKEGQTRVTKFDPDSGEKKLVNPATPGDEHEAWPLLGVHFANMNGDLVDAPKVCTIPQDVAQREEFIELVDAAPKAVAAGPPDDPWRVAPHLFMQAAKIVFHMMDGDYEYRVTKNPGKYDTETDEPTESAADPTTYVTWEYELELVEA